MVRIRSLKTSRMKYGRTISHRLHWNTSVTLSTLGDCIYVTDPDELKKINKNIPRGQGIQILPMAVKLLSASNSNSNPREPNQCSSRIKIGWFDSSPSYPLNEPMQTQRGQLGRCKAVKSSRTQPNARITYYYFSSFIWCWRGMFKDDKSKIKKHTTTTATTHEL